MNSKHTCRLSMSGSFDSTHISYECCNVLQKIQPTHLLVCWSYILFDRTASCYLALLIEWSKLRFTLLPKSKSIVQIRTRDIWWSFIFICFITTAHRTVNERCWLIHILLTNKDYIFWGLCPIKLSEQVECSAPK